MAKPLTSQKRAKVFANTIFLIGLAIVIYLHSYWPGLLLVLGTSLALKQYLLGRFHDMMLTLVIYITSFIIAGLHIAWDILIPVLLVLGGIYVLCKEWVESSFTSEAEKEYDLNKEIEESSADKRKK